MSDPNLTQLFEAAKEAVCTLQEVRTGEDFECVCWEVADKLQLALSLFGQMERPDDD